MDTFFFLGGGNDGVALCLNIYSKGSFVYVYLPLIVVANL